ncbi:MULTISPECIES: MarR family transcriptional regulator [unclassified Streptomyces]|uniref:MarR family transcriptional regulator n=1 Tax=unclassified Streptomyces TaxID=2593676 RepID=UPI00073AF0ED|nr:MarR family transcriptional regulator [Streptomyces sp. AVP053U2]ODA73904.1 Multidrug resistance operon repressor [Streptomyces sp. AVP053U2]
MREALTSLHQHDSPAVPEVGQVLELLEIAWERGRGVLGTAPLSAAQTRVMFTIEREPGINLSTLGRRLSAAAPSVTRLCDRLQAAGFLRRTPRPQDRREMQLDLTDAGIAHLHGLRQRREEALRQAMSRMTPDAQHALATGLGALCDAVGEPARPFGHQETA